MVPVATAVPSTGGVASGVAPSGLLSVSVTVSSVSSMVSPTVPTVTVLDSSLAAKVSVPFVKLTSPASAVPSVST